MRVKNLNDTSSHSCNCSSWLDHWKKFREYNSQYISRVRFGGEEIFCSAIDCRNKATDGGHVKKISSGIVREIPGLNDWYIVPLCKQCNQRNDEFDIDDNVSFASANVATTCGISRRIPDEGTDIRRAPFLGETQPFRREPLSRISDEGTDIRRLVPARREVTAENQALRRVTTELISRMPDDPKNTSRSRFNK